MTLEKKEVGNTAFIYLYNTKFIQERREICWTSKHESLMNNVISN